MDVDDDREVISNLELNSAHMCIRSSATSNTDDVLPIWIAAARATLPNL